MLAIRAYFSHPPLSPTNHSPTPTPQRTKRNNPTTTSTPQHPLPTPTPHLPIACISRVPIASTGFCVQDMDVCVSIQLAVGTRLGQFKSPDCGSMPQPCHCQIFALQEIAPHIHTPTSWIGMAHTSINCGKELLLHSTAQTVVHQTCHCQIGALQQMALRIHTLTSLIGMAITPINCGKEVLIQSSACVCVHHLCLSAILAYPTTFLSGSMVLLLLLQLP